MTQIKIKFDRERYIKARGDRFAFIAVMIPLLPSLIIFLPLGEIASRLNRDFGLLYDGVGRYLFYLFCMFWVSLSTKTWMDLNRANPMVIHRGLSMMSFRVFYLSSVMFFYLAGASLSFFIIVFCGWLFSEGVNLYAIKRLSDQNITTMFKRRFRKGVDGVILYNALENLSEKETESKLLKLIERGEMLGAGIVILLGPFLYWRSFTYRENFEPRLYIIGTITFLGALWFRSMTTEKVLARRAIKLKQQGK